MNYLSLGAAAVAAVLFGTWFAVALIKNGK